MAVRAQMVKWGNSLAVRIPKTVADEAKLREGDRLMIEVETQGVVAIKAIDRPETLEELIAKITPENLHKEQTWGEPVGAEKW
ncbi:MAG: AbrB/MazE/SpoVT family DNA-binding domain-containing protein [Acidobacteria bacterium]|nr:MAG: AbrB/MazE/SpoVT family DNA-binding domain-containing protein [Acidobacteriota bacterium]